MHAGKTPLFEEHIAVPVCCLTDMYNAFLISICYRWCRYLQSRNLPLTRPLGMVGDNRRCAVDDPNGVLINIATPGWNEYEEEVNCPKPVPKGEGRVEAACVLSAIVAIVILSLQL